MSLTHDGKIRITLPNWAPYRLGVEFARNKADWINEKKKPAITIEDGHRVGKAHHIRFVMNSLKRLQAKFYGTEIIVSVPKNSTVYDVAVQTAAEKAAVKALKKEAEQLLPMRVHSLALAHGFKYNSVSVKRLKSRWGSCNERKDIVFNLFLMQLPWHLIDYVILHELMHTEVLRHGQPFWSALESHVPNLKMIRKEMKSYQPALITFPLHMGEDEDELKSRKVAIETT